MADVNDDLSTPPTTLEELVKEALKQRTPYWKHLELGETLYASGRYEEAIVPLATSAELLRDNVVDYRFKSVGEIPKESKFKLYRATLTITMPSYAAMANPLEKEHFTTLMICVDSLMKLKRYDDAHSELKKGLAIASEIPDVWLVLGIVQHRAGNPDKALESFREAVRLDPARMDLWENLYSLYQIHRLPETGLISEGLEKNKKIEDNMALLAHLFISAGEHKNAQLVIDSLLKQDKKNKRVLLPMSILHIINGEFTKAQDTLKKFTESDKQNVKALWYLACIYAIQGKNKDSLKSLEQLLKLDSNHPGGLELQRMLAANTIDQATLSERIMQEVIQTARAEGETVEKIPEEILVQFAGLIQQVTRAIKDKRDGR